MFILVDVGSLTIFFNLAFKMFYWTNYCYNRKKTSFSVIQSTQWVISNLLQPCMCESVKSVWSLFWNEIVCINNFIRRKLICWYGQIFSLIGIAIEITIHLGSKEIFFSLKYRNFNKNAFRYTFIQLHYVTPCNSLNRSCIV